LKINEHRLKNGINVVIVNCPGTKLASCNIIIHAGGRYETPEQYGLSHFLEHMAFKGTKRYPKPGQTTEIIENLGGVVNAWTSEQATCYWNILPKEHIDISLKILSEQVSALRLDAGEINKERGPVVEEIKRANDDPYSFVWHKIYEVMWPNQPIACGVLGPKENVLKFTSKEFSDYMDARYVGRNMTICVASSLKSKEVINITEKYFSKIKKGEHRLPMPIESEQKNTHIKVVNRNISQTHIILAYKTFGIEDERVPSLLVLMTILATGMSSLLFKEIREKRSAAYAIEGATDLFSDAGAALIYAGLNTEKTEEVIKATKDILNNLSEKKLSKDQIDKAKEFIRGIALYRLDGVERTAYWYTTKSLLDRKRLDPEKYLQDINKVTAVDVQKVAKEIFQSKNESLLVLGPYKNKEKFVKILAQK
jgi:predicted Zn-dependent peptidase